MLNGRIEKTITQYLGRPLPEVFASVGEDLLGQQVAVNLEEAADRLANVEAELADLTSLARHALDLAAAALRQGRTPLDSERLHTLCHRLDVLATRHGDARKSFDRALAAAQHLPRRGP